MATLYLLSNIEEDHRYMRLKEEALKKGWRTVFVSNKKSQFTDQGLFTERKKIELSGEDFIYLCSNSLSNHAAAFAAIKYESQMWPTTSMHIFSNKYYAACLLDKIGIPTPKTAFINSFDYQNAVESIGGFPCVVKKTHGSHGKFVELVESVEDIDNFIKNSVPQMMEVSPLGLATFCVQEYIKDANGTDYRSLCLDGEVLGVMKRTANEGFKSNISMGGEGEYMENPPEEIISLSKKVMAEVDVFYAGIDFIFDGRSYQVLEVNTSAQFRGFEAATNINVAEKIIEKIAKRIKPE